MDENVLRWQKTQLLGFNALQKFFSNFLFAFYELHDVENDMCYIFFVEYLESLAALSQLVEEFCETCLIFKLKCLIDYQALILG